ncbi:MAG TPA: hypothetical protein VG737_13335, partial [Cyclobacteriaceae bacterium]|nr:hypothetical protein [Cyclobacteriaceae bacterium]
MATVIRHARKLHASAANSAPRNGPAKYIHIPVHSSEITAGPRLRAGFVLVPEMDASNGTMIAYKIGNNAGVYLRVDLNPMERINSVTMTNVVTTSPSKTIAIEKPDPGTVTPNSMLRPSSPQRRSGQAPRTHPAN